MKYNILKHSQTLELPRVLELLSNEATLKDSKNLALNLIPATEIDKVEERLKETEEAYNLTAKFSAPSFMGAENVISAVSKSKLGSVLSIKELLSITQTLKVIRKSKSWRDSCLTEAELYIDSVFYRLTPNKHLEDRIGLAIKNEEELNDNASAVLLDIRRKITSKSSKLRENLERIIHGPSAKYLQENIITQRNGRFVVPVKVENKGQIGGIVHDASATGSTIFVEPMSVVEINNEIRVLKSAEEEEIYRILSELSALVSDFSDTIIASYNALVSLDLIFAKAKLAYKMGGVKPLLNKEGYVYLKNARHPLISQKSVVPITVSLGKDYHTLMITGPNTGGKTVSLKTVGLMCLMGMCGLMISADDNSEICVFSKIFADIGDEQSIEQSLSTFSSHIVNIISILSECDANSLILLDELCAGTDPVEGAALAKAILMSMAEKGSKIIATTHYPELKSYALDTESVENACCEFDVATLKPTYRLIIGLPGSSNAFAISDRLGLPKSVIETAKQQVSEENYKFERVISSLERAKLEAESDKREISKLRYELEEKKKKADMLESEFKAKQEKILQNSREKAMDIIEQARYKSGILLNELEEIKKSFDAEKSNELLYKARQSYNSTIQNMENDADPVIENNSGEGLSKSPEKDEIVIIKSINREATVIDVDESKNKALVISGSMKMWIDFGDLKHKKSAPQKQKTTRKITGKISKADISISGEIDIRGMASDEGILELDKYIDNALISGYNTVTIIHGKGTGVLRKAVHNYLRGHKNIESFRVGLFGEGENGVTIATIKK